MSVSSVPLPTRLLLWGKAAGRCQYTGCNHPLWKDDLTQNEFNIAYIAHIVADKPDGPRGHEELSAKLGKELSNIMLMCDEHHRLIDKIDVEGHPVERLQEMKATHERRIEIATSITDDFQSNIVLYGANIGKHGSFLRWDRAAQALQPLKYPAEKEAIELSMKNSSFEDKEELYWILEKENLNRQFNERIKGRLHLEQNQHLSIFPLAPIPLLIYFGHLLSDIPTADVYQLHREPQGWSWQSHPEEFDFIIRKSKNSSSVVALNLSLSATINNERITSVLGEDISIWTIAIENPYNDFLKSKEQLQMFRENLRKVLNEIKAVHSNAKELHVFPAVPVSVGFEVGRVRMPKADLPFVIYDENRQSGGFKKALDLF